MMTDSYGAPQADGLLPSVEPVPVSPLRAAIPSAAEIDDAIGAWHDGGSVDLLLHEFLGWTWDEYSTWVACGESIPPRPLPPLTASAIEARRGETQSGSIADESVAPKADAQPSSEPTP